MKCILLLPLMVTAFATLSGQEPTAHTERIAAMERIADLALIPPSLNSSPLPEYDYD